MAAQEEIRLTGTSYAVLGLVKYLGRATSYDLKRSIERSVENFWPVPHTTFYAEPKRLAGAGYLSERQEGGGRRRKLYEITDRGRAALEEWLGSDGFQPPQLRDESTLKVFFGGDPVRLYGARLEWHRAKLEELEGYQRNLDAVRAGERPPDLPGMDRDALESVRLSLHAGVAHHRAQVEMLERFLESR